MKILAVINSCDPNPWRAAAFRDGTSARERLLQALGRLVPRQDMLVLAGEGEPDLEGIKTIRRAVWDEAGLLDSLIAESRDYDLVLYVFADTPFLDTELARRMLENHATYFAEFSFADGFPLGIAPEIISVPALPALRKLVKDPARPTGRDTLFSVLQRDINAFDVETELCPTDMRNLRATLAADSRRNFLLCQRLLDEQPAGLDDTLRVLNEKPALLRTLPAYYQVQIVEGCLQRCDYCPYPRFGGDILQKREFMPVDRFVSILDAAVGLSGDAVIGVSLWGEPSLHPAMPELAAAVAERPGLRLVVETSGLGWSEQTLAGMAGPACSWIVSLDAATQHSYRRLRGNGFEEALGCIDRLLRLFPESTYVQAVRMNENEEELEGFFRAWKERTERVIIQKYDCFSGYLEARKVTDLSPLRRFPCWHLKRDLVIRLDGSVPPCREDLQARHTLGNVFSDGLAAVWERGSAWYAGHCNGTYPELCGNCDEYYTFNF